MTPEQLATLSEVQALAYACAREVAGELREGWTEQRAARRLDGRLQDRGVRDFFHKSFAWFGERTRFDGVRGWPGFLPSDRPLRPGDAVILDTAPVLRGIPADIGYACSLGPHAGVEQARSFLAGLRRTLGALFTRAAAAPGLTGADIWAAAGRRMRAAGYDAVHPRYPGAVLGHRLRPLARGWRPPSPIPFGWRAVERLLRSGVVPDLLGRGHRSGLEGVWAIEPHVGGVGFGCKFEEALVVDARGARWVAEERPW